MKFTIGNTLASTPWGMALLAGGVVLLIPVKAIAQIVPDTTLPNNSIVSSGCLGCVILGGTTRGSSLFHSFREFNIQADHEFRFSNPGGITNIFSRVTGGTRSNIDGTLGVFGPANLFLINPNGISFGPYSRLDLGGSFIASTASSILFPNGQQFSAIRPEVFPLLIVDSAAPVGLQFEGAYSSIDVERSPTWSTDLSVKPGKTLALIGGEINLHSKSREGSTLKASGGRIELGGLSDRGVVDIVETNDQFQFHVPDNLPRAGIWLDSFSTDLPDDTKHGAVVDVSGDRSGSVILHGDYVSLINTSKIKSQTTDKNGGNIHINANSFNMDVDSVVATGTSGSGQGGDIDVQADIISLSGGSSVESITDSLGKGGAVNIRASEINLMGQSENNETGLYAIADDDGNAGDLKVETKNLNITDGASISTRTDAGVGHAGDLTIIASEFVHLSGRYINADSEAIPSSLRTDSSGDGNAGKLKIQTKNLEISDGGIIASLTSGKNKKGNSGDISITGIDGTISDLPQASLELVKLLDDYGYTSPHSVISTSSANSGKAGNIIIYTNQLFISGGSNILASSLNSGVGGNITINASNSIELSGVGYGNVFKDNANTIGLESGLDQVNLDVLDLLTQTDRSQSAIASESLGTAQGGNITINTKDLFIKDGAGISTLTAGTKSGGDIVINARNSVQITGTEPDQLVPSAIISGTGFEASNAGNIMINTNYFLVKDGGLIGTSSSSRGKAGDLIINASNLVELTGTNIDGDFLSSLRVETDASGEAGSLKITTGKLIVQGGAEASVNSTDSSTAGNLEITAHTILLDNGKLVAETYSSNGGDIILNIGKLLQMRNGSQISATAGTNEDGGNGGLVKINAYNGFIVAEPNPRGDNNIKANAYFGDGGKVVIKPSPLGMYGIKYRERDTPTTNDITVSSDFGDSGEVAIDPPLLDPSRALGSIPSETDSQEITESCQAVNGKESVQFFDIGRGGLPPRPEDPLSVELLEWGVADPISSPHPSSIVNWTLKEQPIVTTALRLVPPCQSR
jgi:filamentous hemagglutinin family protein